MTTGQKVMSMTGFARVSCPLGDMVLVLEGRSVNARGLDIKLRLPNGFDAAEKIIRDAGTKRLSRGNVSATLSVERAVIGSELAINRDLAKSLWEETISLADELGAPAPRLDSILRMKGVVEVADVDLTVDDTALTAAAKQLADSFCDDLVSARAAEGARLAEILNAQVKEIAALAASARAEAVQANASLRDRLLAQIDDLLEGGVPINPERFEQEVALLIVKADIREELDRLDAHVSEARDLLSTAGAKGRRLDFLTQEFNREANTLCSKASTMALKRIGLDLKTVVDQLREQVQNVE